MSNEPELIDLGVVDELRDSVGGDEAFIKELVSTYLAESPGYLEAIIAAAAADDATALVRPAHTLKSSSAAIGAMRLSAVSKRLEFGAREGRVDQEAVEEAKALWPQTVASLGAAGLTD
jgi:HPt (histidine-containing phosphotransfer) domain-containing protein